QKRRFVENNGKIEDIGSALSHWLEHQHPFVAYRLPGSDEVVLFEAGKVVRFAISDFVPENFEGSFVAAPFEVNQEAFAVFPEDESYTCLLPDKYAFEIKKGQFVPAGSDDARKQYSRVFLQMKDALDKKVIDKVVLARKMNVAGIHIDILPDVFLQLCHQYPDAFVYFLDHPELGRWMGASPETFLEKARNQWQTVALAATRKEEIHYEDWNLKELEEQSLVSVFIDEVLRGMGITDFEKRGPVPFRAGNVIHLRTSYRFEASEAFHTGQLLSGLHPTPAVGGYPKDEAMQVIRRAEGFDRGFYSGFLGPVSKDVFRFFVNIRCMQLGDDNAVLYIGGGLTRDSREEAEWEETRLKAGTLYSVLQSVKQNHFNESARFR
ncbi:MAG: chorismate-binding protein, partial [Bacteroidota bacterium]